MSESDDDDARNEAAQEALNYISAARSDEGDDQLSAKKLAAALFTKWPTLGLTIEDWVGLIDFADSQEEDGEEEDDGESVEEFVCNDESTQQQLEAGPRDIVALKRRGIREYVIGTDNDSMGCELSILDIWICQQPEFMDHHGAALEPELHRLALFGMATAGANIVKRLVIIGDPDGVIPPMLQSVIDEFAKGSATGVETFRAHKRLVMTIDLCPLTLPLPDRASKKAMYRHDISNFFDMYCFLIGTMPCDHTRVLHVVGGANGKTACASAGMVLGGEVLILEPQAEHNFLILGTCRFHELVQLNKEVHKAALERMGEDQADEHGRR
jgi:hypothetical protein